jgi:glycosyltransferase involved in cell wall biosynthesis
MALGKPVMSFIRSPTTDLLLSEECPIVITSIFSLKEDIARLYQDRKALNEIGRRGRAYIEKYYTIEAVSERMRIAFEYLER